MKSVSDSHSEITRLRQLVEHEVYQNVGQLLVLIKWQLSSINPKNKEQVIATCAEATILLGKAIADLRTLVKQIKQDGEHSAGR